MPVYNSTKMQPRDQISLISVHLLHWRMTSGHRYCLVLMMLLLDSVSWVAPPKSMSFILVLFGTRYVFPDLVSSSMRVSEQSKMFYGLRSVWV